MSPYCVAYTAIIIEIFSDLCYLEIKPELRDVLAKMREISQNEDVEMDVWSHKVVQKNKYPILQESQGS